MARDLGIKKVVVTGRVGLGGGMEGGRGSSVWGTRIGGHKNRVRVLGN